MDPSELEGLIPPEVGAALRQLAARVPEHQAIVEVGSYKGKSTCHLAADAVAHVWAVDPWDLRGNVSGRFGFADPATREAFHRQVEAAGLERRITPVRAFSLDAAENWSGPPIGLLYIDGDHSYQAVRSDFEAWKRWLAPSATVVFDDLDTPRNPGVRKAVEQIGPFDVMAGRLAVLAWKP